MRIAFAILVFIHGLIHLMGFSKAFGFAKMEALTQPVSRGAGLLWLLAALLLVAAAGLLLLRSDAWWWPAAVGLLLSQALIFGAWADAKAGSLANLIMLLPVLVAALEARPSAYPARYRTASQAALGAPVLPALLGESDLAPLPAPVQAYLRFTGSVGKPKAQVLRAEFHGRFRPGLSKPWVAFKSTQVNRFDQPSRAFYMEASMFGLPVTGLHLFTQAGASMQIKVAGLAQVVDARGPKMDQGETVTLLNDLCVMAPSMLADPSRVRWEKAGRPDEAVAVYTHQGRSVRARLLFDRQGALKDFISTDRFLCEDGKTYLSYPWSTPILAWTERQGRKVPSRAELIWHLPEGEFCYGEFELGEFEVK